MPIEYLVPAEISFPDQIRRVAVVNNTGELPGRIKDDSGFDSLLLTKTDGLIERYMLHGDPKVTTESLAESIAAEKYFDMVIICDSALQTGKVSKSESGLSRDEVSKLTTDLDVDMLISLEQIPIYAQRSVMLLPGEGFLGNVDAIVYPSINLYLPNRNTPLLTINSSDSIFWEGIERTKQEARALISDKELIAEASDFAGTVPVKYMTPQWRSAQRFYFSNGSPQMRDAGFFAQKNEWNKALPIWQSVYEQQSSRSKLRAASNIALYYEMTDDPDKAYEWGQIALELARVADKVSDDNIKQKAHTDYAYISHNLSEWTKRREHFMKLKVQMERFNNDF